MENTVNALAAGAIKPKFCACGDRGDLKERIAELEQRMDSAELSLALLKGREKRQGLFSWLTQRKGRA